MPTFSITWRQPGQRFRIVIIVVIYVAVIRFVPREAMPLILGSLFGRIMIGDLPRTAHHTPIPESGL